MELYRYDELAQLIHSSMGPVTKNSSSGTTSSGTMRLPVVLLKYQKQGFKLQHLEQAVFAPRLVPDLRVKTKFATSLAVRKGFIAPFMRALRGRRTLSEVAKILGTKTLSTFHHWETGRRDISLAQFLKVVDDMSGRLPAVLETLGIRGLPENQEFKDLHVGRYAQFFSDPWTPTILMALRLPQLLKIPSPALQAQFLSQRLKIPHASVENSLDLLMRLQLVRLQEGRLISNPVQFDAIPSITPEKIQEIHQYWFNQAGALLAAPGFHKLEQHALTHESKEKIILWISELREKFIKRFFLVVILKP
jgi:hypothetical protein